MQGLVNLVTQIAAALGILFSPACYLGAIWCFIHSGWAFKRQSEPDNPYRGRPWVPWVSLLMCGVLASFDVFLTKVNVSLGSDVHVGLSNLTSYTPVDAPADWLGAGPGETIMNVVVLFKSFFQTFGAMAALTAAFAFRSTLIGQTNRSRLGCGIQFLFGMALINVVLISAWLVALMQT